MINLRTVTYALLIFTITFSCKQKPAENLEEMARRSSSPEAGFSKILPSSDLIMVDLDSIKPTIGKYSDLFSNIKYVPLETTPDNLIGGIEDIQLLNDTLYILDSQSAKSIFVFDLNGRFIRRIGKVGRGPGEWISPGSFSVDKSSHNIYVLDGSSQRIFAHTTGGLFIKTIDLKAEETRSHYIKSEFGKFYLDARVVSTDKNKPRYLLRELDYNGVETKRWFPIPEYNKGFDRGKINNAYYNSHSNIIPMGSDDLKFTDLFMDTIFSISENGVCPAIVLKSKDLLTQDHLEKILANQKAAGDFYNILIKEHFVWSIKNYVENDNSILFRYTIGNRLNIVSISKNSKRINHYLYFYDDLTFSKDGGQMSQPELICGTNDLIIGVVPKLSIFQEALSTNESNLSDNEREDLLNIPGTDNPVLVILQTK